MRSVRYTALALVTGCMSAAPDAQREAAPSAVEQKSAKDEAWGGNAAPAMEPPPPPGADGAMAKEELGRVGSRAAAPKPSAEAERADDQDAVGGRESVATRAWFPETFLFEPLVVTDKNGEATVSARVPDRLTSWRVLALANSREGGLAGAVATFLGTLPVYVDPVLPAFLRAGDQLSLPVQVVNTTGETQQTKLSIEISGAARGAGGGLVKVPAGGSVVVRVPVLATGAGQARVRALLEGADAVERTLPVLPTGRMVEQTQGGTLAAPRTVSLTGRADMDMASARVRLVVYPGALGVLRAELDGALAGSASASDDATALLLAGAAPELLEKLGDQPDPAALRELSLLASQRALQHTRANDLNAAILFAEPALAHPDNPVLSRLSERLLDSLAQQQRPDGTFGGADGWTVQRLLVTTAEAVAAVQAGADRGTAARQRAARVSLRASSAFERLGPQVEDPYTAAAMLASGAAPASMRDALRKRVIDAVFTRPDGARILPVPEGVVRADGAAPSEHETTALAVLALQGPGAPDWLPDLGSALLGGYLPGRGWGDGRTDLLALRAVLALFQDPIPEGVAIQLLVDGQPVLSGALNAENRKDLLILEAPATMAVGAHTWTVRADPPVAGLGYQLALQSWVPWEGSGGAEGALQLSTPAMSAGRAADLALTTLGPAHQAMRASISLPAGVSPDARALDQLVAEGALSRWEGEDGLLTVVLPPQGPGVASQVKLRVIPSLSGALMAGATTLALGDDGEGPTAAVLPPRVWRVD